MSAMEMYSGIKELLSRSTEDIRQLASGGEWTIEALVRAYDLLAFLMDTAPETIESLDIFAEAEAFCSLYNSVRDTIEPSLDCSHLKKKLQASLAPLERACTDARFEAAAAASLHEFAKETYQTWQTAGIFMRKRALKALRERAGFRLESHRIGNYVAKTFDLMNEAQMAFARTQQRLFAADVSYKIQEGQYSRIANILTSMQHFSE